MACDDRPSEPPTALENNLSHDALDPVLGKALFERAWVSAPASTKSADGLGPLFNARSCAACHPDGGAGQIVTDKDGNVTGALILRLAGPGGAPDPLYGRQLQTAAIQGHLAEGQMQRSAKPVFMQTGELRNAPELSAHGLTAGPLDPSTKTSPRRAPTLRHIARLNDIEASDILALADPDDDDRDSISGRPNWWRDQDGNRHLGRFGWKAAEPSLAHQIARAFHLDIGLSSALATGPGGDCTPAQVPCLKAPHGENPETGEAEVSNTMLTLVARYLADLSSNEPPHSTPDAGGQELFASTGCAACHMPTVTNDAPTLYSDFLLHDMGSGLADGLSEGEALGHEWRTAPLRGLGRSVRENKPLLHDGRATGLTSAISWHDGEAATARARFEALSPKNRQALLDFLKAL